MFQVMDANVQQPNPKFPRRGTSTNRHEEKKIAVSLEYVDEFALTQFRMPTQFRTSNRIQKALRADPPTAL